MNIRKTERKPRGWRAASLLALVVGLAPFSAQSETVFQDDFSEADGTAIDGKSSDIGGTWWSGNSANQVNGGALTQVDSGSGGESGVSFSRGPAPGETLTITIETGSGSVFTAGGWTGLTINPLGGGDALYFGDTGSNNEWMETDSSTSTGDSSAPNTLVITYAYDTGDWTLETTALPGGAAGTITAGLELRELRLWDDGAGGSILQLDQITVEIDTIATPSSPITYADWAVSNQLTTGRYDDPDGDGLINLHEYALNGSPTNPTDTGIAPIASIEGPWLYHTHTQKSDSENDLEYSLGQSDNLLSNTWASSGFEMTGTGTNAFAEGFDAVTNRLAMAEQPNQFVRLSIGSARPDEWRGGDISMVPRFEQLGGQYKTGGLVVDPIHIMTNHGMNTFRVRLFVNPDGSDTAVIQDLAYVTALGQRIKNAGAAFLLDIHYSDTWADPGHQDKPAAWEALSFSELEAQVETYSSNVIVTLKNAGCLPDIVQVGNEITGGFIWPEGKLYNEPLGGWPNFTTLLKAGIRGVKQPLDAGDEMEVMVHIDRGGSQSDMRFFYDNLATYNVEYDLIGLSFYPWWHGTLSDLQDTLNDADTRYGKEIVLVETAFPWNSTYDPMEWAQTPAGQKQFMEDMLQAVRSTPNGLGKGVIWWYPEAVADVPIHVWESGANALFDSNWNSLPAQEPF